MPVIPSLYYEDAAGIMINTDPRVYIRVLKTVASDVKSFTSYLSQNPITVKCQSANVSVETVNVMKLNKPFEGTNHYHLTANIPCEAILEVPVVSTGEQTLQEINNY